MRIEIAKHERMSQSGSSLYRLIQNNNMPILDLLARESIQNSLDAASENQKFVAVQFLCGTFSSLELSETLEGISDRLSSRFKDIQKYLAIRDSNTQGLTGPLHEGELRPGEAHGNLLKLVYEISNAQTQEGAGGSWGLGKTVYFRVGIGLVFYYSRIWTGAAYESRLAATLVENETSKDALLPNPKEGLGRGIAWWGELLGERSIPIRDEKTIQQILRVFNIDPYKNDETGTTIIIPYINESQLLADNVSGKDENGCSRQLPFYAKSVEQFLRNSVLKWYAPRIDNPQYNGKYLRAYVGNEHIEMTNADHFFKIMRGLYKKATGVENVVELEPFAENEIFVEKVNTRGVLDVPCAGKIAYLKAKKDKLGMIEPYNNHSPNEILDLDPEKIGDSSANKPIIAYTRKPGMIVSYESSGLWVNKIPCTIPDEFIIGLFVLESNNKFKEKLPNGKDLPLEEYVRKSELADHTSWSDHSVGSIRYKVVSSIQNGVSKAISEKFKDVVTPVETKKSRFGAKFGELLLPSLDFGRRPSIPSGGGSKPSVVSNNASGLFLSVDLSKIKYSADKMTIEMSVSAKKPHEKVSVELLVDTESSSISAEEWENELGLEMPFSINSVSVENIRSRNKKDSPIAEEKLKLEIGATEKECGNMFTLMLDTSRTFDVVFSVEVEIRDSRRDKKPVFVLKKCVGGVNG